MVKDLETGRVVKEWDGKSAPTFCGPVSLNLAIAGATWTTTGSEEKPLIFNQTGSYAVVAKHLFKTVQKEFKVIAVQDGSDTSPGAVASLQSRSGDLDIVKALLARYPNADSVVTANYHSKLFDEFQKYDPHGIAQYSAVKVEPDKEDRMLTLTIIFDRYYENNSRPLILFQCKSEGYNASYASERDMPVSTLEDC